jgi:hypothetical protein
MLTVFRFALFALSLALAPLPSAFAQNTAESLEKEMLAGWQASIVEDGRPRTLTIKKLTPQGEGKYLVEGTFGFSSAGQGNIKGELVVSGNEKKLSFTTPSENLVLTTQKANGSFVGSFATKGKPWNITLTKFEQVAAEAAAAAAVAANRVLLSKAEMETIVLGKTWRFFRRSTGQTLAWEFRAGGTMFGVNETLGITGSAQWRVTDAAQMCVKFPGQGQTPDACYVVAKEGAAFKMFDASSPSVLHADLTVE